MTIRKTRFPNRIFYFCIRVRYAYNRLYIHFNRLLSFFNLSKYLNTICWSWDVEWISKENSNDIFSCSRFRPGIEKNSRNDSTRKLLNCVNFSFLRRISGSKKLETWKREKSEKKRETNILSPTDRIIEEIGFIFDEKGLFSLFKLHHHTKITLYVNGVFDRWGTRHNCV